MNPSTAMARVVVDQLIRCGVRDVVLCPGSRSAPLALECAAAERRNDITLHVRIDERSAGFVALGIAKITGAVVPVICTSGSAVANLAPAIVEASYAGVPLVALTADRPPELRNTGANQTIDQVGFFGRQVRHAVDIPPAVNQPGQATQWRRHIVRACDAALAGRFGGPVHVNVAFRDPLVPSTEVLDPWCEPLDLDVPALAQGKRPLAEPIDYALGDIGLDHIPTRSVVVVGDAGNPDDSRAALALAQACGWPVIGEPSGNTRTGPNSIDHAPLILANSDFAATVAPELIVTVGRFGLSRSVMGLVASAERHIAVALGGRDNPDPLRSAAVILNAVPLPPRANAGLRLPGPDYGWLADWRQAANAAHGQLTRTLADATDNGARLCGPAIATAVWDHLGSRDLLLVAASRPVRDIEAFAVARDNAPRVIGNRGAAGIDGLISTAWGAALASGCRTVALLGDLAFLHDHNGLLAPRQEPRPDLTIVVSDNNGGGIFSSLEQGAPEFAVDFERVFGTPHDRDLAAIARATGTHSVTVTTRDDLVVELDGARAAGGVRVIVAKTMPRGDEAALRLLLRSYW